MKSVFMFLLCIAYVSSMAQSSLDTDLQKSKSDVIAVMGGSSYSKNHTTIYKLNIRYLINGADSVYVGIDNVAEDEDKIIKKAIIYLDGTSGIREIFITSEVVLVGDKDFVCDYVSYLDIKGLVYELFPTQAKDKRVLDQFTVFLTEAKLSP